MSVLTLTFSYRCCDDFPDSCLRVRIELDHLHQFDALPP